MRAIYGFGLCRGGGLTLLLGRRHEGEVLGGRLEPHPNDPAAAHQP
jgi:hypothetical protein